MIPRVLFFNVNLQAIIPPNIREDVASKPNRKAYSIVVKRASEATSPKRFVVPIRLTPLTTICSIPHGSARFPEDRGAVPAALCQRGGVPRVRGGVALAGWLPLPDVSPSRSPRAAGAAPLAMSGVRARHLGDRRDGATSDANPPDALVLGDVSRDIAHAWLVGPPAPAPPRDRPVRDRVGHAPQAPARDGSSRPRAPAHGG